MGLLENTAKEYYEGNDSIQNTGDENFGNYQFTSLKDIINQFMIAYVGEGKIIPKAKVTDVQFHAMRALQELSFDTFKSCKAQEIEIPPSLVMPLPQDYVNYVKLSWVDNAGIKRILYPTSKTSNPFPIEQETNGDFIFEGDSDTLADILTPGISGNLKQQYETIEVATGDFSYNVNTIVLTSDVGVKTGMKAAAFGLGTTAGTSFAGIITVQSVSSDGLTINLPVGTSSTGSGNGVSLFFYDLKKESDTWEKYKTHTPAENANHDYDYDDKIYEANVGQRYGVDPQHAQTNGSYYIDCNKGLIHFSSNISGKTVILDYISDSLGTDDEMQVHKFAEEAMYKSIAYGILSTTLIGQPLVPRFKKEKFAAIRQAKLRLSNIKLEEIAQVFRGKSKWIKH